MPMNEFGRIIDGFWRNRFEPVFEGSLTWFGRYDDLKTEFGEKPMPKWIILIHVQNAGDANFTARCFFAGNSFAWEQFFHFFFRQIGIKALFFFRFTRSRLFSSSTTNFTVVEPTSRLSCHSIDDSHFLSPFNLPTRIVPWKYIAGKAEQAV